MNSEGDTELAQNTWYILYDYISMRRSFKAGLAAMPEKSHSLTLEEANHTLTLLETKYPFLQEMFPHDAN